MEVDKPDESRVGGGFADNSFSIVAATVGYDQYLGRTCPGRIVSGSVGINGGV